MSLQFEWDENKARSNARKHGLTFEEASSAFADPLAAIFGDVSHSAAESREILIGHSSGGRLVVVSFTERSDSVRIISARRASSRERSDYERGFAP